MMIVKTKLGEEAWLQEREDVLNSSRIKGIALSLEDSSPIQTSSFHMAPSTTFVTYDECVATQKYGHDQRLRFMRSSG